VVTAFINGRIHTVDAENFSVSGLLVADRV
jgi:predicted amidohydrolase YtcJ